MKVFGIYLAVYPIPAGFVSGGERHFLEVFKRLSKEGAKITTLTDYPGDKNLKNNQIKYKKIKVPIRGAKVLCKSSVGLSFVYLARIIKSIFLLRKIPKDKYLIFCSCHYLVDVLPAVIFKFMNPGSRIIVYLHHLAPGFLKRTRYHPVMPSMLTWLNQLLSLFLIRNFADIVFSYTFMVPTLKRLGVDEAKICFTHNSVDLEKIEKLGSIDRDSKGYDACFLGRLAPLKGIFDIVDMYGELRVDNPDAKIAVMGADIPKYSQQLKAKIKDLNLENNIIILGAVSEEEKYSILKSSKVFVFPSYEEGWGIAILEAMACGLAIIAYDLPAYQDFSEPIVKIPVGDKVAFLEKLKNLLSDESTRFALSKMSKQTVKKFNWDRISYSDMEIVSSRLGKWE